jgi:thiol:disulfide interchange protein
MKIKYLLLLFVPFCFSGLSAQIYDPVDFSFSVKQLANNEAELLMHATIEEGWHVYSLIIPEESMVLPTEITFEPSENYSFIGAVVEPDPIDEFDKNAGERLRFHENEVTFRQRIAIKSTSGFNVKGELSFMVCNDEMCLPPEYIDLDFAIKGVTQAASSNDANNASDQKTPVDDGSTSEETGEKLELDYANLQTKAEQPNAEVEEEANVYGDEEEEPKSNWAVFLICFGAGLIALITPCVFPMMPMTVSFFTKQSKTKAAGIRNAFIYGACIILVYVLLSVPFHIFDSISPSILNEVSTNVPLNLFFFVIFIVFAISFFGAFEITLPNSWINKADSASDKGGFIGIFFMAITLVLVSFSCTGPVLGGLLGSVLSTDGGPMALTAGMAGFGFGLALPFGLFAAFPSWLNSIPKSGGWLNNVKVVLGFLEFALAFKFLSNADLVLQAGLLQREVFLAIWIGVFLALTIYLFNGFRMPHDSPTDKLSITRMLFGLTSLIFTIYLIPGLWGAPLKGISGFPPPSFYSESPGGFGQGSSAIAPGTDIPDGADPEHCPHGLNCFHDYEKGLAYAKEVNKPILLDFTGWACVNCRKMEEQVWSDARILEILREDVVLISLYVDERHKLPESEQYVSDITGKKIKTVGNKWSDFQTRHFQNNSQPMYAIIGHDNLEPLNGKTGYDPDIELYEKWLNQGVDRFKKAQ